MQLKKIMNAKDAGIDGVEFVKVDKHITEVVIGGKLRIRVGESYNNNLSVLIEQPFEEVERFRMTATIDGFDPKVSLHESDFEAGLAASAMADKGAETIVEKVKVLVDDNGQVQPEVNVIGAVAADAGPAF